MGYIQDEIDEAIGKRWLRILIVVVGLFAAYTICAGIFSFWPFSIINKVTNANAIVQNYEWFYDMEAQIKATKAKAELAKGTPEENGIRMVLETMIGEYNSKSRMITRNLWKAKDLPYQIESEVDK